MTDWLWKYSGLKWIYSKFYEPKPDTTETMFLLVLITASVMVAGVLALHYTNTSDSRLCRWLRSWLRPVARWASHVGIPLAIWAFVAVFTNKMLGIILLLAATVAGLIYLWSVEPRREKGHLYSKIASLLAGVVIALLMLYKGAVAVSVP